MKIRERIISWLDLPTKSSIKSENASLRKELDALEGQIAILQKWSADHVASELQRHDSYLRSLEGAEERQKQCHGDA